jgi:hypothetical protein
MGFTNAREDGRFAATPAGKQRHAAEILHQIGPDAA